MPGLDSTGTLLCPTKGKRSRKRLRRRRLSALERWSGKRLLLRLRQEVPRPLLLLAQHRPASRPRSIPHPRSWTFPRCSSRRPNSASRRAIWRLTPQNSGEMESKKQIFRRKKWYGAPSLSTLLVLTIFRSADIHRTIFRDNGYQVHG